LLQIPVVMKKRKR